jgi:serine/threonine protein kinase/ABC-type branched-subunit amino acid transport system substrate-binding protein
MALADGAVFAGYRIIRLIGAGGMGEVYLAAHPRLPRQDALKILARDLSTSGEFHERFTREADLAAKLFHPSIVGVHDRGDDDGQLWIAMDYVDGPDAAKLLRQRYPAGMPVEEVIAIIEPVASALDYAHRSGLLHRDVKPANILLAAPEEDGQRVFLADFGISRQVGEISGLTATNLTLGTVAYCAPEQLMGAHIDGRADQYALGATAFHLLTGTQPYEGTNPVAVISNHLNAAIPRVSARCPDLAALDPVFARVLAKQPEDRFSSCREFAAALRQATSAHIIDAARAAADPTMAASTFAASPTRPAAVPNRPTQVAPPLPPPPEQPGYPQASPARSKKPFYVGGAAALVLLAVGALIFMYGGRTSPTPQGPAAQSAPASAGSANPTTGRGAPQQPTPGATAQPEPGLSIRPQAQIDRGGAVTTPSGLVPAEPAGHGNASCPPLAIAVVGALDGPDAALATNIRNGAQLAVDANNAANPGCQIQLRSFNTGGDPQKALAVVPQLIADPAIVATIGPAFSGEYKATGGLFNEAELVAATASATNVALSQQGWSTFIRGLPNDSAQGPALGNYLSTTLGLKRVCVIDDGTAYGTGFATAVRRDLATEDPACAATIPPGSSDLRAVAVKVQAQSPDAVFYSGYWTESAELIRRLRKEGFAGMFISGDGSADPAFIDTAGDSSTGAILSCSCAPFGGEFAPLEGEFTRYFDYFNKFNQRPGSFSAEGYDLATIFIEGLKAGATTRPAMLNFVRNYNGQGIGRTYNWAENGELAQPLIWIYKVR